MRALLLITFLAVLPAAAFQSANSDFDSLAQRASAALASDPKQAIDLYRQALGLRPEWAEGWFYLGAGLFQTNQFADSKHAFQKAAALAPDRGTVWGFLGLAENQLGETAAALNHMRKGEALGLADDAKFVAAIRNTAALIYIQQRNYSDAMLQLRDLARRGDHSDLTITELGAGALGLAMPETQTPLVHDAGEAAFFLYSQQTEQAKTALENLTAKYPATPGVHYLYGLYLLARDKTAARAAFAKEWKIAPNDPAARLQLAMLDIEDGNPQHAAQLAREASKLDAKNPLALLILGRALLEEKRYSDAIQPLQTSAELSPENAEAHLYLEQAYKRLGKTAEAHREHEEFTRRKAASDPVLFNAPKAP